MDFTPELESDLSNHMDVSPEIGSNCPKFSSSHIDVPLFPNSHPHEQSEDNDISFSDKEELESQAHEAIDMPSLEEMEVDDQQNQDELT